MNTVSQCCHASTERIRREPKDIEYRHMSEVTTICLNCRQDCDTVEACECCGEVGCFGKCEADQLFGIG
jgi:hypothetical protein